MVTPAGTIPPAVSGSPYQFEDVAGGHVCFKSWVKAKERQDDATQTSSVEYAESETQAGERSEAGTQTDAAESEEANKGVTGDGWMSLEGMREFLQRTGNLLIEQLQNTETSQAFDDYEPLEEEGDSEIACKYTLRFDSISHFKITKNLQCTGVSWNTTGSMIAASYGRFDHSGWCDYRAALCMWNIFSPKFRPDTPDIILETSSGLMCVACHPQQPAIVAAGSFNGEVLVWNVAAEEPLIASTKIDDYFHREPVLKIEWVYDFKEKDYQISSVSGDGKILIWSLKNKLASPVQGFRMVTKDRKKSSKDTKPLSLGGTAIAFPTGGSAQGNFVVASEGGKILRCLIKKHRSEISTRGGNIKWSKNAESILARVPEADQARVRKHVEEWAKEKNLREVSSSNVYESKPNQELLFPSPIDFSFHSHVGPVHSLEFSPFHRNLFLSCGSDGSARIYSLLQARPLRTFEPSMSYLYAAAWSRSRPMVFATGSEDGALYIYDLLSNSAQPSAKIVPTQTSSGSGSNKKLPSVYTCAFNPKVRNFLATGDARGTVRIWQLTWKLSNLNPKEGAALEKISSSAMKDENEDYDDAIAA